MGQPLDSILNQIHLIHVFPPYFPKIHSHVILPSTPRSSKWFRPFRFSNQIIVCASHLFHACYLPRPSRLPWFDHPNNIWWSLQVVKLLIMRLFQPRATSFLSSEYSPQLVSCPKKNIYGKIYPGDRFMLNFFKIRDLLIHKTLRRTFYASGPAHCRN